MRALAVIVVLAVAVLAASGCGGQSSEDKAQSKVCDARADIQKQVDTLRGLTLTSASIGAVQQSVSAIGQDLSTIKSAAGDLSGTRKQDVEQALSAFEAQVSGIAGNLAAGLTGGQQAKAQLHTALEQLASGFRTAFKPVSC